MKQITNLNGNGNPLHRNSLRGDINIDLVRAIAVDRNRNRHAYIVEQANLGIAFAEIDVCVDFDFSHSFEGIERDLIRK